VDLVKALPTAAARAKVKASRGVRRVSSGVVGPVRTEEKANRVMRERRGWRKAVRYAGNVQSSGIRVACTSAVFK